MFISIISWMTVIGVLLKVNGHNSSDQGFHRCGSDEHLEYALSQDPGMRGRLDAIEEHWRQNPNHDGHQVDFRRRLQTLPSPLVIPINFIITKGPSDPYIGYEQIISQIRALNIDYQGSNPDKGQNGRGSTSEFSNKAGNFNIRFSLNKIKRKDTTKQGFDNVDMMSESTGGQSNEDPEHALNFWVNSPPPGSNTLGWTFGPGVEWKYDGIVQRPDVVGSKAYDRNNQWTLHGVYNLGRTATHEIGHWLNLVHIWGPGASGCGSANDDLVSDTPDQEKAHGGCPADGTNSCGTNDMYMNFMDYSNDNCMNMFTIGQIDRGDDLFLAGGHRVKLLDYVSNPTDTAFVDYFYFVNGNNAQCDNGHTRRDLNLNEGAGGDYIYLCISYSRNPYVDVITDIDIKTGGSSGISCNSGYEKIDSNLNEDAGGDHVYVCYKKESRQASSPIITDLFPFAFDSSYSSSTYNGYTLELVNLNKGAGGKYIYLGSKGKSSTIKGPNYFKGPQALKYSDAAAYCQSQGTKLASIGTVSDYNDAKSVCTTNNNDCWIGLRDDLNGNDDGIWAWDDGIDITKSYGFNADRTATKGQGPWNTGEPNEWNGIDEDCVQIYHNGRYNDAPCGSLYHPLCNKARVQREYVRGPTQLNYGAASTYCTSQGLTLASIVTQTEWDNAKAVCGASNCWIGLKDDITDMIWSWDDGSRISNSYGLNPDGSATTGQGPWNNGEPNQWNGNEEDCVHMSGNDGKYNDNACSQVYYPLCSRIGNGQSGAAKSVHEHVSYHPKKNNIGDLINMNMYYGSDYDNKQYSNNEDWKGNNIHNNDNWMNVYHEPDNNNYREYSDNYHYGEDKTNNNDYNINGIEISTNMLILIICGLIIINIICLGIYCMDNNKCKLNKKERGYKVVKYESEDRQLV